MTPYIGEGAEECKLTAHMLKTDRGVLWKVGGHFFLIVKVQMPFAWKFTFRDCIS